MKTLSTFASAAVFAAALVAMAAPAYASTIGQFNPDTTVSNYKWINSGVSDSGTGGHFFSISNTTSTVAQGVSTHFSFMDPAYAGLAFLPAVFTIDATAPAGHPASQNGAGVWTQTGLNGSFIFVYSGPSTTIDTFSLVQGVTVLLSGVFTDARIQGAGGSGSLNLTISDGGSAVYNSDMADLTHLTPDSEEFAFNLLGVTPHFDANSGRALKSFRANGGGNISGDLSGNDSANDVPLPEPATWGLTILGLGGIGLMIRTDRKHRLRF